MLDGGCFGKLGSTYLEFSNVGNACTITVVMSRPSESCDIWEHENAFIVYVLVHLCVFFRQINLGLKCFS